MNTFVTLCSSTSRQIGRFCAGSSGATAIEYAMIAAGVGAALAATITSMGSSVTSLYTTLADML